MEIDSRRKNEHIEICASQDIVGTKKPFAKIKLIPEALPEIDFANVSTQQQFLGRNFSLPIMIAAMTGGIQLGEQINDVLAFVASQYNIPLGLGSQKIILQNPDMTKMFALKKRYPQLFLIGNLGAVSLNYGIKVDDICKLIDILELNAFALHLNALQECIQPEGEKNFSKLLKKISQVAKKIPVPLIIKEVGAGINGNTFLKLVENGATAVDVGGAGGTSWSAIEGKRGNFKTNFLGELFRDWGYTTEECLLECIAMQKKHKLKVEIIATGGIQNGIQIAQSLAVGANMCGIGLKLFKAVVPSDVSLFNVDKAKDNLSIELEKFKDALTIALFCCGAQNTKSIIGKYILEK